MNATVARIVDILFQDTEMSEEVVALKDEVMNNCQERFDDMTARGMSEDDAIAAVVDSLKGMEEVVNEYPRKEKQCDAVEDEDGEVDLRYQGAAIRQVDIGLISEDVTIGPSMDDAIHVSYNRVEMPELCVRADGDTLRIGRDGSATGPHHKTKSHIRVNIMDEDNGSQGGKYFEWHNFSDFMSSIMKTAATAMNINRVGAVDIQLPDGTAYQLVCRTTCGDVEVKDVTLSSIVMESTSGDVSIDLQDQGTVNTVQVKGSSGDVEARLNAREAALQTMSGDVSFEGNCPHLTVSTVSGDMEVSGCLEQVLAKSVSGDVNLTVDGETLQEISSRTTSGDLTICLPEALRGAVRVDARSISGDISNHWGSAGDSCRATVVAQSVSGDVRIE